MAILFNGREWISQLYRMKAKIVVGLVNYDDNYYKRGAKFLQEKHAIVAEILL